MGVLTDFIVAKATDAKRLGDHRDTFDGLDAKGIDQIRMGALYALLTGTEYDPSIFISEGSFVYEASDDGPWVQVVPENMVMRLAELSPDEMQTIGDAWFQTGNFDFEYSRWARKDVAKFLAQIQKLANRAIIEGKTLFMWTCL